MEPTAAEQTWTAWEKELLGVGEGSRVMLQQSPTYCTCESSGASETGSLLSTPVPQLKANKIMWGWDQRW